MSDSVFPSVNLNGTSRSDLIDQNLAALQALRATVEVIRNGAPHGRDYPDHATYAKARAEFEVNLSDMRRMISGYEATLEYLADAE
jgi:hypothetical protein